jgi:hypothetical protein
MAFDPISIALDIGGKVIDRLWPDPLQANAAKLELLKMQQNGELAQLASNTELAKAQLEVNAEEAKNSSIFVAGWRPFIGWVCGAAFAWNWIGLPAGLFVAELFDKHLVLAQADMSEMLPVLLGMLGLGALRTTEKIKKVA